MFTTATSTTTSSSSHVAFVSSSDLPKRDSPSSNCKVIVCTIDDAPITLDQLATLRNVVVIAVLQSNHITSAQLQSALLCDIVVSSVVVGCDRLIVDNRHRHTVDIATAAAVENRRENDVVTERVGTVVWDSITQPKSLQEIPIAAAFALKLLDNLDELLIRYSQLLSADNNDNDNNNKNQSTSIISNNNNGDETFESKLSLLTQLISSSNERVYRSLKELKWSRYDRQQ